jgi:hypothetical protein
VSFLNTIWSMEVLASAFVGPVTTIFIIYVESPNCSF